MTRYAARFESPLGPMVMVSDGACLIGLYFEGQKHFPTDTSDWVWDGDAIPFLETDQQLEKYFSNSLSAFTLPLNPKGTAFQRRVWDVLASIPHGACLTYSDVAHQTERPSATRAVGTAVGKNPLSIIVPCHRVLGRDGALRGYAGGLDKKAALLAAEKIGRR